MAPGDNSRDRAGYAEAAQMKKAVQRRKAPITGREGGRPMLSVVFMITVVLVALGLFVRRGWWQKRTDQLPPAGIPRETLALEAFMQGNSYLAGEQFNDATAAFQRARELDSKCLHVA